MDAEDLKKEHRNIQSKLFTPVHEHINIEVTVIYDKPSDIKASSYVGEPSLVVDEAWYRLLRHHNIRIIEDELQAMNQTSIPLRHGGGYQGMMAVFHELHCLKLVREAVHADYYYAEKSHAERAMLIGHTGQFYSSFFRYLHSPP
ncbi:hypothetical protein DTO013E5_9788 [Penicillium roqueforti]|nr:hypothetical protein DTO012A1_9819 [Penicillium roqueforti]KAI2739893.1 hypothetical protein DTO013F2_9256 [Penicillium roqueforti]KAI2769574.1 hypothetical protein DTO012A8_5489 [Penicillium roqueforti]KAI3076171.1 hypothetical protein CBS147339_5005 [Penicillium roqueforti]KAI3093935.1 hypothetical protein CBS147338_6834 [Penicillium roqueforti]